MSHMAERAGGQIGGRLRAVQPAGGLQLVLELKPRWRLRVYHGDKVAFYRLCLEGTANLVVLLLNETCTYPEEEEQKKNNNKNRFSASDFITQGVPGVLHKLQSACRRSER